MSRVRTFNHGDHQRGKRHTHTALHQPKLCGQETEKICPLRVERRRKRRRHLGADARPVHQPGMGDTLWRHLPAGRPCTADGPSRRLRCQIGFQSDGFARQSPQRGGTPIALRPLHPTMRQGCLPTVALGLQPASTGRHRHHRRRTLRRRRAVGNDSRYRPRKVGIVHSVVPQCRQQA